MSDDNVKEDFLEVDPKIPGQNYVCMSFVSPEAVLQQKELFFVTKFLQHFFYDETLPSVDLRNKIQNNDVKLDYNGVKTIFEDWKYSKSQELESEFFEKNEFHTSMRGLKIRGSYDTYREATVRAQVLRKKDPNFNVFIGQVGYWLPWDPAAEQIQEQEYQESMLNDLVKKYKENLDSRDELYEQVKQERIQKAKKETSQKKEIEKAETKMNVIENTEESTKNINELREIVDEADKLFYEHQKRAMKGEDPVEQKIDLEKLEQDDPWMQRKKDDSEKIDEPSDTTVI